MNPRIFTITLAALLALWLLMGVYSVAPNEQGVLIVLGQAKPDPIGPGLHWRLPFPLSRVAKLKVHQTRRVGVGSALIEAATAVQGASARNEFVTGDNNLINLELVVQYSIRDLPAYLFTAAQVEPIVAVLAEAAASRVVAEMGISRVFYENKVEVQERVHRLLRADVQASGLGVSIDSLSLQKVRPAPEVTAEFNDVVTAKADALRTINEARSYASALLPRARGEAAALLEAARAEAFAIEHSAAGEAKRFQQVYAAYRKAPELTRLRMYTETFESILQRGKKVIIDPSNGGSVIQFGSPDGPP